MGASAWVLIDAWALIDVCIHRVRTCGYNRHSWNYETCVRSRGGRSHVDDNWSNSRGDVSSIDSDAHARDKASIPVLPLRPGALLRYWHYQCYLCDRSARHDQPVPDWPPTPLITGLIAVKY